jgi:hypothetical protein
MKSRRRIAFPKAKDHANSGGNYSRDLRPVEWVAQQQSQSANVAYGSRLCKNVTARDGDRMNVSANRNYGSGSSQACSLLLDPRKIILGGSEIFAFLHSLGHKQT